MSLFSRKTPEEKEAEWRRKEEEKAKKELEKKQKEEDRKRAEQAKKDAKEAKNAAEESKKDAEKKPGREEKPAKDDSKNGGKKKRGFRFPGMGFFRRKQKAGDGKASGDAKSGGREKHKGKKKKGSRKKKEPVKLPFRINLIPPVYKRWVGKQLYFSGSESDPAKVIRNLAIISLIISLVAGALFSRYLIYVAPSAFIVVFGLANAMLVLAVDRRGRFVDEILPDALLLLSANIRAGYIPSRALILSARKEFGPLSDAIRRAGKEIMTGASLEEGMKEIPKRIKSKDLERSIKLIIEGIRGGGQIVTLLEENATDIRRRQAIRKEISANIMMYAIFIAFAGCLGAPGLYALSAYLTTTMTRLTPDMSMSDQISSKVSFIKISGANVSGEFLFQFSIAAILITTVFGGIILAMINSGKEKDGLKYAPILAVIALGVFFAASFLVNTMFSSMLPG